MLTSNFAEAGGFLKTRADLAMPDIQLHFVVAIVEDHARKLRWGHGFSCHVCLLRPRSRGTISLRTADPLKPPAIDPNFLDHPDDVEDMVAGFKLTRRLMDAPALASRRTRDLFTAGVHMTTRSERSFGNESTPFTTRSELARWGSMGLRSSTLRCRFVT